MFDDHTKFVKYSDLKWSGVLKAIRKSANILQPLFEAFTNSLESIRLRQQKGDHFNAHIKVIMDFNADMEGKGCFFNGFTIVDNGIGFDNENYRRLITFKDDTKGFNNRGSGRLQMILEKSRARDPLQRLSADPSRHKKESHKSRYKTDPCQSYSDR